MSYEFKSLVWKTIKPMKTQENSLWVAFKYTAYVTAYLTYSLIIVSYQILHSFSCFHVY